MMNKFLVLETILLAVSTLLNNNGVFARSIRCPYRKTEPVNNGNRVDEYGKYFEGDMLLSKAQIEELLLGPKSRNGLRSATYRWPDNTVVYYIEEEDFDEEQVEKIETAMADIVNQSCIKFQPTSKDERQNAVTIKSSSSGCSSSVGFLGRDDEHQVLNLGPRCFKHGTIVHEMLHTLGFYHMQSTYDRDDFVKIVWENIIDGKAYNFKKYTNDTVIDFGIPYDYSSVMHYSQLAFSKNKNATIIPLQEGAKIGQRKGLSEGDILKLNRMYCEHEEE